jgi:hypothetical protein
MSDHWGTYHCLVDGKPARLTLDLGLLDDAPDAARPHMVGLRVHLRVLDPDRLAEEHEEDALADVEDRCEDVLGERLGAVYVGRVERDGVCDLHFYAAGDRGLSAALREAMGVVPGWKYQPLSEPDRAWDIYLKYLYPDARQYQSLLNGQLIDNLRQIGDDLVTPRPVRHTLYFAGEPERRQFLDRATKQGFALISTDDDHGGDRPFSLAITKTHPADRKTIDATVNVVLEMARDLDHEYDGWESDLVGSGEDFDPADDEDESR